MAVCGSSFHQFDLGVGLGLRVEGSWVGTFSLSLDTRTVQQSGPFQGFKGLQSGHGSVLSRWWGSHLKPPVIRFVIALNTSGA